MSHSQAPCARVWHALSLALSVVIAAAAGLSSSQGRAQAPSAVVDWSKAQTVEIDLKNFAFSPASIRLKQGAPYRLHFVNQSSGGHDFTAKDFFAAATIDPATAGAVSNGTVRLSGSQSADVGLVAPQVGHFEAHCSHLMHATFGMAGEVVVE
jgi:plastocyanin